MPAIEFKTVDIVFGDDPAGALSMLDAGEDRQSILAATNQVVGVANASISVESGEICVLMGLSGSGKSTLMRAVNGLNKVTRGSVLLEDNGTMVDVANCDAATLRRLRMHRIAMVFQQFALFPWRTVRENVGFGLELRGVSRQERGQIIDEKLSMVGLKEWQDKYAHELSGGMQQRVGLARAFATDADILLMDEPFSALDPLIRARLQDELLDLQRSLNKTILFVSHDLDEALKIGTHIAIMESGRIVQYGTPEEIVLAPANAYVADFVAHMNPLNVLRGESLMTPVESLEIRDDYVWLDASGRYGVALSNDGGVSSVTIDGEPGRLSEYRDGMSLDTFQPANDQMICASPSVSMRTAIEIRHATGLPVPLLDGGRLVGVIGDAEIYEGMLRQAEPDLAAH